MIAAQQLCFRLTRCLVVAAAVLPALASAQGLLIYTDSLQNGFQNYSYNGTTSNFSSTAKVHSGNFAIAFTPTTYDATKFAASSVLNTGTYAALDFWFYGTQSQCQNLDIILEKYDSDTNSDVSVAQGSIASGANCDITAGQWKEITVDFTAAPINFSGNYDRVSISNRLGNVIGTVYFDDVSLTTSVIDEVFANGFEGGTTTTPMNGLIDEHNVTYDTFTSDRFTWYDSAGKKRVAVLAHNDAQSFAGSHGGELREFIYQTATGPWTVIAPVRDDSGDGGFGYIVSHPGSEAHCVGGDSSSLGHQFAGMWTRLFEGRHHAIFRFQQMYPRYCGTTVAAEHDIPVTIDWSFSTGHDDALWSVTYDMSSITANVLNDDSRAPYGTMNIDGSSGSYMDSDVAGIRWGDRYQFITQPPAETLAQLDNPWNWASTNSIPFVELWTANDGAMGLVQTQTMSQQDAGGGRVPPSDSAYDVSVYWNKMSSQGQACPDGSVDQQTAQAHSLPCVGYWPYQANSFSYGAVNESVNDAKMTWGTQYGFLGQTTYDLRDSTLPPGSTAPGHPRKSYAVYVVFGQHSAGPVDAEIARSTALTTMSVTASTGQVATTGPGGAGRTDDVTYSPAGYDPVYGAIVFSAAGNAIDATIGVGSALSKPLIIVRNYTSGAYPTTVKLGNTLLTMDVDYFPSLRTNPNELWITLNRDLTGASNRLQISP